MMTRLLAARAADYLERLCVAIPTRRVGSAGNRAATAFFGEVARTNGFEVETPEFRCIDWIDEGADLTAGGETFEVHASPYSLGVRAEAPLVAAATLDALARVDAAGRVLLVRGEITREQLMPLNFPFYNPEEHRRILALLQAAQPLAVAAATSRNPELAGAVYPFPLIEDGDFDIPSIYMTEEEGARLAAHAGRTVVLDSRARRIPSTGCNCIARKGAAGMGRAVFCAHIDAKRGTPGALDNAAGVVVLLLLAELLQGYDGRLEAEIVAINGEDYYAARGEICYLEQNRGRLGNIVLCVNLDAPGDHRGNTAYSLYDCPDGLATTVRRILSGRNGIVEGEPWFQGDHMIFVQSGVPALAVTSERFMEIESTVAHTALDQPELVDPQRLSDLALALQALLLALDAGFIPNRHAGV
jgi:aminopeptidase YwaD